MRLFTPSGGTIYVGTRPETTTKGIRYTTILRAVTVTPGAALRTVYGNRKRRMIQYGLRKL